MYKLISLNVNSIAEKPKRELIFDFIQNFKADIYLLQETHNDNEVHEKQWEREWGGLPPDSAIQFGNVRKDTDG